MKPSKTQISSVTFSTVQLSASANILCVKFTCSITIWLFDIVWPSSSVPCSQALHCGSRGQRVHRFSTGEPPLQTLLEILGKCSVPQRSCWYRDKSHPEEVREAINNCYMKHEHLHVATHSIVIGTLILRTQLIVGFVFFTDLLCQFCFHLSWFPFSYKYSVPEFLINIPGSVKGQITSQYRQSRSAFKSLYYKDIFSLKFSLGQNNSFITEKSFKSKHFITNINSTVVH